MSVLYNVEKSSRLSVMYAYIRSNETLRYTLTSLSSNGMVLLARDFLSTCSRLLYYLPPETTQSNSSPSLFHYFRIPLISIMKRNPFTHSNHFDGSSKRRRIDPGSAGSHQTSRPGIIDQRLIEGSQCRGYPDLIQQATSPIQTSTSSCHDEDAQLDAFGK